MYFELDLKRGSKVGGGSLTDSLGQAAITQPHWLLRPMQMQMVVFPPKAPLSCNFYILTFIDGVLFTAFVE